MDPLCCLTSSSTRALQPEPALLECAPRARPLSLMRLRPRSSRVATGKRILNAELNIAYYSPQLPTPPQKSWHSPIKARRAVSKYPGPLPHTSTLYPSEIKTVGTTPRLMQRGRQEDLVATGSTSTTARIPAPQGAPTACERPPHPLQRHHLASSTDLATAQPSAAPASLSILGSVARPAPRGATRAPSTSGVKPPDQPKEAVEAGGALLPPAPPTPPRAVDQASSRQSFASISPLLPCSWRSRTLLGAGPAWCLESGAFDISSSMCNCGVSGSEAQPHWSTELYASVALPPRYVCAHHGDDHTPARSRGATAFRMASSPANQPACPNSLGYSTCNHGKLRRAR